eukprot:6787261-Pyramimonas_sp.AAC.2
MEGTSMSAPVAAGAAALARQYFAEVRIRVRVRVGRVKSLGTMEGTSSQKSFRCTIECFLPHPSPN